ncbi:fimbrillin family protein [Phocaeicola plebeius]|uniref:fimbrillin family protein n=1 Tax=Phocaeicola plebeius TaxID=310297 RepID=UPI0026F1CCB4|nr:fimbrillin family protein [Phocaeicola plebeius]
MKTYRTIFLLTIWAGLMLLACTKQEEVYSDTDKVCLSASIGSMTTRVDDGGVVSGTYYLTYNSSGAKVCMVTFADSKGYPLVSDNGIYQFLKWNDVMPEKDGKYQFTLDNLDDKDNPETVTLGEAYKAAPLNDKLNDKLDIVWGKQPVEKGKESAGVNFELSHRMSKISLEISVGTPGIALDGKPVKITLTDVISEPATFNRTSGAVSVAGKQRSEIVLYDGEFDSNQSEPTYSIPSWIFPPQTFDSDNWPKLRIVLGGTTYEGTLNHYMVQEGSLDTPVKMTGFKSGQHLTLKAKLSKTTEEVELIFMPVWVRRWEEIDNIGIGAKQRGVYTKEDYEQLVTAYNKEPKDEKVLDEYGTDASGIWTFVLFRNIGDTTGGQETMPKFKDDGFEINFNSYTVYGYGPEDDKSNLIDNSETSGGCSGD